MIYVTTPNPYTTNVDMDSANGATVTKADVESAALELLNKNGFVTTLHIKTFLRMKGFWVSQKEVSTYMGEIANERDDIGWTQTDRFRTYTTIGSPVGSPIVTGNTGVVTASNVTKSAKFTYRVTGPFGQDAHTFEAESRGRAKWLWAKATGNPFFFARARKV